jgi:hypothetical protein
MIVLIENDEEFVFKVENTSCAPPGPIVALRREKSAWGGTHIVVAGYPDIDTYKGNPTNFFCSYEDPF